MRNRLTNRIVSNPRHDGPRTVYVHDKDVQGFCVAVTPRGLKSFYFYGRVNGRPRRIRLGAFPGLTVSNARKACQELVGDVARGRDVAASRKHSRRTLGDLFAHYMTVHAKPNKRTWKRDEREFERFLSKWLNRPLGEIRRSDVTDLLSRITERHGKGPARKVRALLHKMFQIGIRDEWTELNPVTGTERPEFDPRERYLRPSEVAAFFEAVSQLQRTTTQDFILAALFTGARRSNVACMRWDEINFSSRVWVVPAAKAKGKRAITIPLVDEVLTILKRRQENRNGSPWVFPGQGATGHLVEPKAAIKRIRDLSGIDDFRLHDLRRTLGAWQNNAGVSLRLIQQSLGHADVRTTAQHYTPTETEAVRKSIADTVRSMLSNGTG